MERVNKKFTNPVRFFLLVHTIVQQNTQLPINAEHCRRFQVLKLDFSIFPGFLQHFFQSLYKFFTGFKRKLVMELFVLRAMEDSVIFCILIFCIQRHRFNNSFNGIWVFSAHFRKLGYQ